MSYRMQCVSGVKMRGHHGRQVGEAKVAVEEGRRSVVVGAERVRCGRVCKCAVAQIACVQYRGHDG